MPANYDEAIGIFSTQSNRKLIRYLSSHLEKYDITSEQWVVLTRLFEQCEINQKRLSEKAGKDPATLARILDILQRKGLIDRKSDKQDRRAFAVIITEKGRELKNEITPVIETAYKKILYNVPEEKLGVYKEVLLTINENIDNITKDFE